MKILQRLQKELRRFQGSKIRGAEAPLFDESQSQLKNEKEAFYDKYIKKGLKISAIEDNV